MDWWGWLRDADNQRTLTFVGGALAAIVMAAWGVYVYVYPQGSARYADLALAIASPEQVVPIQTRQPHYAGETVFCEAVRLTLIASHNQAARNPIRLMRLTFESEPVQQNHTQRSLECQIDVLNLKTHGIVELGQYKFWLRDDGVEARYLKTREPDGALKVDPANVFASTEMVQAVTLQPEGDDAHYQLEAVVEATARGLYRTRFKAFYDIAGQTREVESSWLYVFKGR